MQFLASLLRALAGTLIVVALVIMPCTAVLADGLPEIEPDVPELEVEFPDVTQPEPTDYAPVTETAPPFVAAVRLGVFGHNTWKDEEGVDAHGQVLFNALQPIETDNVALDVLLNPKLHIGGSLNLQGDTSFGYAGATWQLPLVSALFLEADFGLAIHDGERFDPTGQRASLGCSWAFREAASIGLNINEWEYLLTVEHLSNASLCDFNDGLTNFGVRVGRRF